MLKILQLTIKQIVSTAALSWRNYINILHKQPLKVAIASCCWLVLLACLSFLLIRQAGLEHNTKFISAISDNQESIYLPGNTGSDNYFLNQLKLSISATASIFDNFVSFTPDPGGRADCKSGTTYCTFSFMTTDSVVFPSTATQISSTKQLTNMLLSIIAPLGFILISMQAFNIIIAGNTAALKQLAYRSIGVIVLLILTPYILSISIIFVNQLSSWILGNTSLTGFINSFVDSIEIPDSNNAFYNLVASLMDLANSAGFNPLSYLYALPVLLAVGLIMLLLLFISFQFILRFLNLYFLATIYPVAIIFGLHTSTQSIVRTYWKQWITFLLQQPVFIIGFAITNKVLVNLFTNGVTFDGLIIFIGMLVFLGSINLIAGRLWGDIYTIASQNITAALAANELKHTIVDKPLAYAAQLATLNSGSGISTTVKPYFNTDLNKGANSSAKDTTSNKRRSASGKTDNDSALSRELRGSGYSVKDKGDGRLAVSGNFYTSKNEEGETGILYTSKLDALRDGVKPKDVARIGMSNLSIQDASNKKMTLRYNDKVMEAAALGSGHASNSGVGYRSNDARVKKNLNVGKSLNLLNNTQGVGVKSDSINGDKSIVNDNMIKLHIYKSVINNKI